MPIWFGSESEPSEVRLIMGDTGILIGAEAFGGLRLMVRFDRRYPQVGHGMASNCQGWGNNWVFNLAPTARGHTKLADYSAPITNRKLEVLATQAGIGSVFEVQKASKSTHDRGGAEFSKIDNLIEHVKKMLANFLSKAKICAPDIPNGEGKVNGESGEIENLYNKE